jgi:multidrug resistance efflux pump
MRSRPRRMTRKRAKSAGAGGCVAAISGALLLIAAIAFGWYWFTELRWLESTDDAYTQADNTIASPKVAGYISELLVTDNQIVKAGELLLLRIDPRDYQVPRLRQQSPSLANGGTRIGGGQISTPAIPGGCSSRVCGLL